MRSRFSADVVLIVRDTGLVWWTREVGWEDARLFTGLVNLRQGVAWEGLRWYSIHVAFHLVREFYRAGKSGLAGEIRGQTAFVRDRGRREAFASGRFQVEAHGFEVQRRAGGLAQ